MQSTSSRWRNKEAVLSAARGTDTGMGGTRFRGFQHKPRHTSQLQICPGTTPQYPKNPSARRKWVCISVGPSLPKPKLHRSGRSHINRYTHDDQGICIRAVSSFRVYNSACAAPVVLPRYVRFPAPCQNQDHGKTRCPTSVPTGVSNVIIVYSKSTLHRIYSIIYLGLFWPCTIHPS